MEGLAFPKNFLPTQTVSLRQRSIEQIIHIRASTILGAHTDLWSYSVGLLNIYMTNL
jgi:hypothetical protein